MNIQLAQPLLDDISAGMVRSSPEGWKRIVLDVTAAANVTDTGLKVDLNDGTTNTKIRLAYQEQRAVTRLRDVMYRDQVGTWYNATFVVDESGTLSTEFDYDGPPFGGICDETDLDSGTADPEMLLEDQRMYPRAVEHLPAWHPAHPA